MTDLRMNQERATMIPQHLDAPLQSQPVLQVRGLRISYGKGAKARLAVADVSFEVERGELACLVGPSGAGKTSLLRCIAGLQPPTGGEVMFEGSRVESPPEGMSVVFQDYGRSLFPWMTVLKNVTFPLASKGLPKKDRTRLAMEMLDSVGLADYTGAYPWALSGGMQQRVAIARALAFEPHLLLMDEPFASLDAQTRSELEDLTLNLNERLGVTIVFITHDIDEAVYLADKVVVLGNPPSTVDRLYEVDLPKPRDQVQTKSLPEYTHLRAEVVTRIHRGRRLSGSAPPTPVTKPPLAK